MSSKEIEISVSNPSGPPEYSWRTDFVEASCDELGLFNKVRKSDIEIVDKQGRLIDFQVDSLGTHSERKDVLVFLAKRVPPAGSDDYSERSTEFIIRETTTPFNMKKASEIRLAPYEREKEGILKEGDWDSGKLAGVELENNLLKIMIDLGGESGDSRLCYAGAGTSVRLRSEGDKEFLEPLKLDLEDGWKGHNPEKQCMRIDKVTFSFPLKGKLPSMELSLFPKSYDVIYHYIGSIRGVVVLRSGPFYLVYRDPFEEKFSAEWSCYLYRTIAIYPNRPYLVEDVFVEAKEQGNVIYPEFVAHYCAWIGLGVPHDLKQFEHTPDWFALSSIYPPRCYSYGFSSDAHVAGRVNHEEYNKFRWQLGPTRVARSLHLFMNESAPLYGPRPRFDNWIGRTWYEALFKPLRVVRFDHETAAYRPVGMRAVKP